MPQPEKAEKLRIDETKYDSDAKEFLVGISCKFGIATAGDNANFKVNTTLEIDTGGSGSKASAEDVITKAAGAEKDADGFVALESQRILWDAAGHSGNTSVTTTSAIIGPSGNVMGGGSISKITDVMIEDPGPSDHPG